MKPNTACRILSALGVEAVPVPHDDPVGVIPDPVDEPEVQDSLVSEEDDIDDVDTADELNTGPDVPKDGGTPGDREQVQEYSTKTTDVTGKPALDAEELDEINSLLGTATFSFGDTTYDVIRLGGSWYIKGEKPEEGDGGEEPTVSEDSQEEDSDEAPGEADNESPEEAEEGDEEAEDEAQEDEEPTGESIDGEDDGDAGSDESEETAARIHAYLDSRFGHLRPPRNLTEADYDAWVKRRTVTAELGPASEESLFYGEPNDPELTGVGTGMTEESIKPEVAPSFAITRDRLEPGDAPDGAEMSGNENPSQTGVQAPSMAAQERACLVDAMRVLRAHYQVSAAWDPTEKKVAGELTDALEAADIEVNEVSASGEKYLSIDPRHEDQAKTVLKDTGFKQVGVARSGTSSWLRKYVGYNIQVSMQRTGRGLALRINSRHD
ncbi:hypothetical protein D3C87_857520 [compost metagenome]